MYEFFSGAKHIQLRLICVHGTHDSMGCVALVLVELRNVGGFVRTLEEHVVSGAYRECRTGLSCCLEFSNSLDPQWAKKPKRKTLNHCLRVH